MAVLLALGGDMRGTGATGRPARRRQRHRYTTSHGQRRKGPGRTSRGDAPPWPRPGALQPPGLSCGQRENRHTAARPSVPPARGWAARRFTLSVTHTANRVTRRPHHQPPERSNRHWDAIRFPNVIVWFGLSGHGLRSAAGGWRWFGRSCPRAKGPARPVLHMPAGTGIPPIPCSLPVNDDRRPVFKSFDASAIWRFASGSRRYLRSKRCHVP